MSMTSSAEVAAIAGSDREEERILTLHGGMDEEERERVKQCFNDAADPVRILIGTDAAREGGLEF